ncbi:Retrovirus-related Pol polyprotein from type-1 retrotransposable element [Trichinella nativa]|uniref:Retrovirus-related Pol polyprotein from type-1 retrotransposable element n=1 Tax=Trichinella nativa TaxID=6335 RepID=A0A0V1KW49_9BILA|nr:Retrovirus-related Pol polyprotein from type-1 retrotransposable element [Trichinella nativa]
MSKLAMFKRNLGGREFYQFPSAAALRENGEVHDDDIQIYCDHLDMLQKDMQERFQDVLKMKILNWMIDLFSNSNEIEMELKEELIDLQTNEELKPKFKDGYYSFCLQNKYLTSIPQLKDCRTTLIPKTDDPRPDAEDYRQITIVSCVYRLFSKIVTRRLEDSLSLNPRQKALREAHKRGKELNIVSTDLAKAFDTINHSSIDRALCMQGLDVDSRNFTAQMVTGSSTVINPSLDCWK